MNVAEAVGETLAHLGVRQVFGLLGAAEAVARLVRESPLPSLVTVRSAEEGGTSALEENARIAFLARVAKSADAPRLVDLEHASMSSDVARALLAARDYVVPDDVKQVVHPVLRHRLVLSPELELDGVHADDLLDELLQRVDAVRT